MCAPVLTAALTIARDTEARLRDECREQCGSTFTTTCNTDCQGNLLCDSGSSNWALYNDLGEGVGKAGDGREVPAGGDICTPHVDPC